ncbi:MAG: hypothetical protein ACI92Z_001945, partial [Paracoccaceae bacterium]
MAAAVKANLNDFQHAETRSEAKTALALFTEKYKLKYEKGVNCMTKDSEAMLVFFDFRTYPGVARQPSCPLATTTLACFEAAGWRLCRCLFSVLSFALVVGNGCRWRFVLSPLVESGCALAEAFGIHLQDGCVMNQSVDGGHGHGL